MGTPQQVPIPILSLFCGAGGLDYGFQQAGFDTILAVDRDEAAVTSYNGNLLRKSARIADLSQLADQTLFKLIEGTGFTPRGVVGGPPCQGFSLGNTKASVDDPRNFLATKFSHLIEIINNLYKIDFFVFENVIGLRSSKHGERLSGIKERLDKAGFEIFQDELDAQFFDVPQQRKRLFLVGVNRDRHPGISFTFPHGSAKIKTVRSAIEGLPDPVFRRSGMTGRDVPFHPNHWTMLPSSKRFLDQTFNTGRSFRRLDWERPSWTVAYGNREIHIHPDGKRRLTILEAMLLQRFPKRFVLRGNFSQQVQQVSNAVPPPVARAVASAIRRQLFIV